ncbi:hypothetical protein [Caldovatus aquaticus]|uniref:Aminotransferase class V-fold PLP-dependent enzyme n=1 Tax=Caldovatus aquaticus TaxID=2865671 RepID=A0ABS7EYU1_9PROT|nr:hypothetical protein [Caldovatus aquaticus]MBW8268418.1 hypothetical protein [Caldovatus aquaticus]
MLPCQRAEFDLPHEVAYLNAASWSPLPRAVLAAGHAGVERKARSWTWGAEHQARQFARARAAAAALIGAEAEDIALIPSVGYGVATAGRILPIPRGARVLVLEDDHSSPTLEWITRATAGGFAVEAVRRPEDGDWTAAVLAPSPAPAPRRWRSPRSRACTGRMAAWWTSSAWPPRCARRARRCWWT